MSDSFIVDKDHGFTIHRTEWAGKTERKCIDYLRRSKHDSLTSVIVRHKPPDNMRHLLLLFILLSALATAHAQGSSQTSLWKTLAKITYTKEYDELMGFKIDKPVFSDEIKALDGKTVEVRGFIIPTEGYKSHTEFIFSAFPYSMCFFCGGAGPETVMEVETTTPVKFTAEAITLKGVLHLNADDINRLMYSLSDATPVETQ